MSEETPQQKGCQSVRVWSYIVGGIYTVVTCMAIILFSATLAIYHREDIQADKSEGSLATTSLSNYIIGFIIAIWSFACAVLMLRGIHVKRTNFIMPFLFWNALLIVVTIFGSIVEFIVDLVHKKTFGTVMLNFIFEFACAGIIFFMLVPVVLYFNILKSKPQSPQLRTP